MMVDGIVLFLHGVNTRSPLYADPLFRRIKRRSEQKLAKAAIYWGDIAGVEQRYLASRIETSKAWSKLWYRDFRGNQLLQFMGDAAIYISRHAGTAVTSHICQKALKFIKSYHDDVPLHLVTHSWGTIILFDLLFAERWQDKSLPGYKIIHKLRRCLYGIDPKPKKGIKIGSIHTMGSPLAMFSLLRGSHDIRDFYKTLGFLKGVTWSNYLHPGDPLAYPIHELFEGIDIQDIVLDVPPSLLHQSPLGLVTAIEAHNSYWTNGQVASCIAAAIRKVGAAN